MLHKSKMFLRIGRNIRRNRLFSQFVLRNSLEQYIYRNLSSASHIVEEVNNSEDGWVRNLQQEELKETSRFPLLQRGTAVDDSKSTETKTTTSSSPETLTYTGNITLPITSHLHIFTPDEDTPRGYWPVFRLMDADGTFRDGTNDSFKFGLQNYKTNSTATVPFTSTMKQSKLNEHELQCLQESLKEIYPLHTNELNKNSLFSPAKYPYQDTKSDNTLLRCYTQMVRLREMDVILQNAQRQGRISFYMTCRGEEGIHLGAASALELEDTVFAQYREAGLLMWRGFTSEQFTDQCFSNEADLGKGRQMPVHYGSRALNYQTISSPLGTQIPQAVGAAYRLKHEGKQSVTICFFGDGCSSTTDFHSGLNFAATLKAPVIFFCRNNGYAISTPVAQQYNGDGIISRAPGYGMAAIRVDGNDVFAVNAAVRESREYALKYSAPVLIEAMTYRQSHHSTSDDSSRYRSAEEVQVFADESDPLSRFQKFLSRHIDMTNEDFRNVEEKEKLDIIAAMKKAECKPPPPLEDMFEEVYHQLPPSLREQQHQLKMHLQNYSKHYDTE